MATLQISDFLSKFGDIYWFWLVMLKLIAIIDILRIIILTLSPLL